MEVPQNSTANHVPCVGKILHCLKKHVPYAKSSAMERQAVLQMWKDYREDGLNENFNHNLDCNSIVLLHSLTSVHFFDTEDSVLLRRVDMIDRETILFCFQVIFLIGLGVSGFIGIFKSIHEEPMLYPTANIYGGISIIFFIFIFVIGLAKDDTTLSYP